jgi:subtilisin family serine protease
MKKVGKWRYALSFFLALVLIVSQTPLAFADSVKGEPAQFNPTLGEAKLGDPSTYSPDKILVTYEKGYAAKSLRLSSDQETVARDLNDNLILSQKVPESSTVEKAIAAVKKAPGVIAAQPNYLYKSLAVEDQSLSQMATTNDPMLAAGRADRWSWLYNVSGDKAWDVAKTEKKVTVAVIDSGITVNHEDLRPNINLTYAWDAVYEQKLTASIEYGLIDPSGDSSATSHGTHVAGIIGAAANNGKGGAGISYNASILPVNAFYWTLYGQHTSDTTTVVSAYNYLIGLKTSGKVKDLRVINLSLGGSANDPSLHDAIIKAEARGILTVAAAGNDNSSALTYPSDYNEVLSVTAINSQNQHWQQAGGGSNHNTHKDICAPGVNVVSTINPGLGAGSYYAFTGTSMASPVVAGAASLMWAANPNLSVSDVKYLLTSTADDLGAKGRDNYYGYGRVNALDAVNAAKKSSPIQGFFNIRSKLKSTLVMDVANGSTANKASIAVHTKNRTAAQVFQLIYYKKGNYYLIKNTKSQKLLTIKGSKAKKGAVLFQYKSLRTNAQRWMLERQMDGSYLIVSKQNPRYCIEIPGSSKKSGTKLKLNTKRYTAGQKFVLSANLQKVLPSGTYTIAAAEASNQVLYVNKSSKKNRANVKLAKISKTNPQKNAQRFTITFDKKTGMYKIVNINAKKPLSVAGDSLRDRANVWIYASNNKMSQRWYIEKVNAKQFRIYAAHSGKALDIAGGKAKAGKNVYTYRPTGKKSQIWTLKKT